MFAVFAAILCLASLSHSAPLACEDLVRPLDHLDLGHLQGRWVLVAGSLNDSAAADILNARQSVAIELHNFTYTQANRKDDQCQYYSHNISVEGNTLTIHVRSFNFTGTFLQSSCADCITLRLDLVAPNYESVDLYLFSKGREGDQKDMEKFKNQVECLKLTPPVIMDETQEICPEQTASEPVAKTEEKTEGQKGL